MEKMEQLIIEEISLDESQARVTVNAVPDIPGLAAQVFDEVAQSGVVVDMIVQNVGREGRTNISFTMPQRDLEKSLRVDSRAGRGLGLPAARQFAARGQAVGFRRRHEESHERRQPPVCGVGKRRNQRRSDQHHRGPRQRHRGRRHGEKAGRCC